MFSGTGSVGSQLRKWGFQVISVDKNPRDKPDHCIDILQWDYKKHYRPGEFWVIAASVPCEEYSTAKTTQTRDLPKADLIVTKVLEIVQYFQPKLWWIENPRNGLLGTRPFMTNLPYVDTDYCQFSEWGYMKPTRFWGSPQLSDLANVKCDMRNCINLEENDKGQYSHRERLGGMDMKFSPRQKGLVPSTLVDYLLSSTFKKGWTIPTELQKKVTQRKNLMRVHQIDDIMEVGKEEEIRKKETETQYEQEAHIVLYFRILCTCYMHILFQIHWKEMAHV